MQILYEDELVLAVNKPPGVVVNRAESVVGETVQEWIEGKFSIFNFQFSNIEEEIFIMRSGIAHRLDKDTSGVLLIGKTPRSLAALMGQFKERLIQKEYLALVHGEVSPTKGWYLAPLKRKGGRVRKFGVDALGKQALTYYELERMYEKEGKSYTLLNLRPKTGRTHQIRVQLSFYKHALVADELYTPKKMLIKDLSWCPRHFLHASQITFEHPITKTAVTVKAELPDDLRTVLESL